MGWQIIKQPDGKFAIWSSIVDNFIFVNCDADEVVAAFVEDATKDLERSVREKLEKVEADKPAYYQFTKTWDEAIEDIRNLHGEEEAQRVLKYLDP